MKSWIHTKTNHLFFGWWWNCSPNYCHFVGGEIKLLPRVWMLKTTKIQGATNPSAIWECVCIFERVCSKIVRILWVQAYLLFYIVTNISVYLFKTTCCTALICHWHHLSLFPSSFSSLTLQSSAHRLSRWNMCFWFENQQWCEKNRG